MINLIQGKEKGTIFCIQGNSCSLKVYTRQLESKEINNSKISID